MIFIGAGGLNMPGGAPGMYGSSEGDPTNAWPPQMAMSGSAYLSHPGSQLGKLSPTLTPATTLLNQALIMAFTLKLPCKF